MHSTEPTRIETISRNEQSEKYLIIQTISHLHRLSCALSKREFSHRFNDETAEYRQSVFESIEWLHLDLIQLKDLYAEMGGER